MTYNYSNLCNVFQLRGAPQVWEVSDFRVAMEIFIKQRQENWGKYPKVVFKLLKPKNTIRKF